MEIRRVGGRAWGLAEVTELYDKVGGGGGYVELEGGRVV